LAIKLSLLSIPDSRISASDKNIESAMI